MNFMAGINIGGKEVRKFPDEIVKVLKHTPINWIRVHSLPNRKLLEKEKKNVRTYLDGINHLCRNGYNIIAPLEVGYKENTDIVRFDDLDKFIEESYDHAACASRQIAKIAEEHHRQVIFGIENEIEPKSWILQSLPGIGWRASVKTWVTQALNVDLKYKRLNNILDGILDTNPGAKTMTNVNAEDPRVFVDSFWDELYKCSPELKKHSIVLDDIYRVPIDWQTELLHIKERLDVDYVGLDNYSNYIKKYPVYGSETGGKVTEAASLSGKQVLNAEFGYTTYRTFFKKRLFNLFQRPSAPEMQRLFFENSLRSIENPRKSMGTFPWVLFSDPDPDCPPTPTDPDPDCSPSPKQECCFGLTQLDGKGNLKTSPAFDYYVNWLTRMAESQRS
jgi:hypothetical protein